MHSAGSLYSYWNGFGQYKMAKLFRQTFGCQDIHRNTQNPLKLHLDCGHIHERCLWRGIDQDVQVAALVIIAMEHRTKNARIARTVTLHH